MAGGAGRATSQVATDVFSARSCGGDVTGAPEGRVVGPGEPGHLVRGEGCPDVW
jgi:hypothetical protein